MSYTVFSCPRAMEDVHILRQTNAILSWLNLEPKPEVLLMGDDPGVPEFAEKHGCRNILVERNDYGTPLVNDIFKRGWEESSNDLMIYINADIIMSPNTGTVALHVAEFFNNEHFLACGRRWDCDGVGQINFDNGKWFTFLMDHVRGDSRFYLRNHGAIDHWTHFRGFPAWEGFPEMYVGRSAWDNLLVSLAVQYTKNTVETTSKVDAIHQNIPNARIGKAIRTPEQIHNRGVYHKYKGPASGTTKQTAYVYGGSGIVRR